PYVLFFKKELSDFLGMRPIANAFDNSYSVYVIVSGQNDIPTAYPDTVYAFSNLEKNYTLMASDPDECYHQLKLNPPNKKK
ncbi:hypothetical protein MHK_008333, partial [Candidatus Magnetomorum sp. HK-1]